MYSEQYLRQNGMYMLLRNVPTLRENRYHMSKVLYNLLKRGKFSLLYTISF